MSCYYSALNPEIVPAAGHELTSEKDFAVIRSSGLFEAMEIAADLASMELLEDRIPGLDVPDMDRRYIRLGINLDGSWETHRSSLFAQDEIWTVSCGFNPNSIFWHSLHDHMSPGITQTLKDLIVPAAARVLKAGVPPLVMLVIAEIENLSNHQRLALKGAEKAAREVILRASGPALS